MSNFTPQSIVILGRQPALGIAELESLYGSDVISKFGTGSVLLSLAHDKVDFDRLGGSIKLCQILTELPSSWSEIESYLVSSCSEHQQYVPEGKLTIGVSVYGMSVRPEKINKTGLAIKKAVKQTGRSVRIVPNKTPALNSAQILHNGLIRSNGWELVVISDGNTTYLGLTSQEQDIEAYSARDQARPARDARVGMLPPKLAQIIINLAVGQKSVKTVLDPFCGTGVVLQEATLMGYDAYGTDLEPRMVEYSTTNLHWLREKYNNVGDYLRIELGDATTHTWESIVDTVACETYLGQALSRLPEREKLTEIMVNANKIHANFLKNITAQLQKGSRLCLAVPAWRGKYEFLHLPMLDHLTDMGYTRLRFTHVSDGELIYHRDDQVVGRELLVLEKL